MIKLIYQYNGSKYEGVWALPLNIGMIIG